MNGRLTILCSFLSFLLVLSCGDEDPAPTGETTGTITPSTSGGTTSGGDGTTGSPGICTPGDSFCNGDTLFGCNATGTELIATACPYGCENAQCRTGCVPGPSYCKEDGKTKVTCPSTGEPVEELCTTGCQDGSCVEIEKICEPGEILCELGGKKLVKCSEDGLSAQTHDVCDYGCEQGSSVCSPPVCDTGDTRCAPDAPLYVEVCTEAQTGWEKAAKACEEACIEGECFVSTCALEDAQCGPTGVEVCNEEKTGFVVSELCKAGCLTTVTGPVCALCNEGLVQCNSDEDGEWVEECVDPLASFQVKEVCTALQSCAGGSCLNVLPLSGTASAEDNYLLLSLAFVDCWLGATEGLCRSIDTTELDYSISYDQLRTWFCDNKEDTDFPASFETTAQFEAAADIYGNCSTFEFPQEEDLDFEIDAIAPGEFGLDCMGYSTAFGLANLNSKEVVVKPCGSF